MPTPSFTDFIKAYLEAQFGGDVPPIPGITIDSELSTTSTNPVQNKVITAALALKAALTDIPQMATQTNMSDWTSGKTVDAAVLAHVFVLAIDSLNDVTEGLSKTSDKVTELDDEMSVIRDYPLVKEYTAAGPSTGNFDLAFDRPLKAMRVLIEGVANGDVSAKANATLQIWVGNTSANVSKKAMYAQMISKTAITAFVDIKPDQQMGLWISDGSFGPVTVSNGWLDSRQTYLASYGNDGDKIFSLRIKPDATNGVSVTTGMRIKVYGLEAS